MREKYNSVDLFKFIMACCVVAIHTEPMINCNVEIINILYNNIVTMAVPFFFIASGFLLGLKMDYPYNSQKSFDAVKSYLFGMIKLYIIWSLIYLPLAVYRYNFTGISFSGALLRYLRSFMLYGANYNSSMLWYLLSTIYAAVLLLVLLKFRIKPRVILLISGILYLFGMVLSYLQRTTLIFDGSLDMIKEICIHAMPRGRIFTGAFYIFVGILLQHCRLNTKLNLFIFFVSFAGACLEIKYIDSLFTIISCLGLFGIVESIKFKDSALYPVLRKMSTVIYFIHFYVWTFYYAIRYGQKTYGMDCFLVTLGLCVIISLIFVLLKQKLAYRRISLNNKK